MGHSTKNRVLSVFLFLILLINHARLQSTHPELNLIPTTDGIQLTLSKDGTEKLVGTIGEGYDFSESSCIGQSNCAIGDIVLDVNSIDDGFEITWTTDNLAVTFTDCFDLKKGQLNWFGGPQRWSQKWPVEKLDLNGDEPYIIKRSDNFAVAERYWLNSLGAYIFLDNRVPLFVDQNNREDGKVCYIAKAVDPYLNRSRNILKYTIIALDDPKVAQLHAVNTFLGKPADYPDERMVREPIWTTWAKYKKYISDEIVIEFAQDILDHGFDGGQLEIDDDWERCYGAQEFKSTEFADIENTVSKLKELNFRVTLWVHPFVNSDCESTFSEGSNNGFFVKNTQGEIAGTWWDGDSAGQIDFTNPEAAAWYSARLEKLRNSPGIDSFKFDAGEYGYAPEPTEFPSVDQEFIPNILTESYVRNCATFGKLIEARSTWRTQDLPVFTRMIDKDSKWTDENGLYTLLTTLLQMNLNGYPLDLNPDVKISEDDCYVFINLFPSDTFDLATNDQLQYFMSNQISFCVLPDMIGGNGYGELPTVELVIRWTQANTFMPSMQFSFLPWDIDVDDTNSVAIVKQFVDLHRDYADVIIDAMKASVENGSPVNPPIWWVDPTDPIALATDDEYLLGETILVAPVIEEGKVSRNVYLPVGNWKDGNSDVVYEGPITITDYPAPLDTLPYFIKQ